MAKIVAKPVVLNGKEGSFSYSKNSFYQRLSANVEKNKIDEEISKKLDVQTLSSMTKTFCLVDLGCSVGPNTFGTVQTFIESIKQKYLSQCPSSPLPEFQVFFNDLTTNDFNTLFNSLPKDIQYYAAGVPGSFYDRLFPQSSIHFMHAAYALHWLSKVPEELLDVNSASWNKGRVHYTSAPNEVVKAYSDQFAKDMGRFLSERAKEIVSGGMMVIITTGIPHGMPYSKVPTGLMFDLMAASLMDMVNEGLIQEAQVDSFNLPFYTPSPVEMTGLIKENECFTIERMELSNPSPWLRGPINVPEFMAHVRAAMKGMFMPYFKYEMIDEIFNRLTEKLTQQSDMLDSCYREGTQLLVVLKRK